MISVEDKNKLFWDEMCGTLLWKSLGLNEITTESLNKFDKAYFSMYPYLKSYVGDYGLENADILEIGLGFGSLSQYLFTSGKSYTGVDLASGPVKTVQARITFSGEQQRAKVFQGNATNLDLGDQSFDRVYSIGCLHHTGNTPQSISEIYRVLRSGGEAVIMLYNARSLRQVLLPFEFLKKKLTGQYNSNFQAYKRSRYDANSSGEEAPVTEFFSAALVKKMCSRFSHCAINRENLDFSKLYNREKLLNSVGRIAGTDLYIVLKK